MTDINKRTQYYHGQFLQKEDFIDEQAYHLDRLRRHLRQLHTFGIAEGLTVTANVGDSSVTIQPGTAIDNDGRPIVLIASRTVPLGNTTGSALIVISYREMSAVPATLGDKKDTRWLEEPDVKVVDASSAPPENVSIRLAQLQIKDGKIEKAQDASVRTTASARLGPEIAVERLRLRRQGIPSNQSPVLSSGAPNQADIAGNLRVTGTVNGRDVSADGMTLDRIANATIKGIKLEGNIDLEGTHGIVVTKDSTSRKISFSTNLSTLDVFPSGAYLKRALKTVVFSDENQHGHIQVVDVGFKPKVISMVGTFVVQERRTHGMPFPLNLGGPLGGLCILDDGGGIHQSGHGPIVTQGYVSESASPFVLSTYSEYVQDSICYMACYGVEPSPDSTSPYYVQAAVSIDAILLDGFRVRLEKGASDPYETAPFTASMTFTVLG